MAVVSINVGPKRVHLTAYCPDDELGLLACDCVLARAAALLDGTSETDLRKARRRLKAAEDRRVHGGPEQRADGGADNPTSAS